MQAWRGQYDTRVRRAADAAAAQREKERERAEDEACVAALAAVEANLCEQLPVAAQATAMPHAAEAAEDAAEPTIVPEVARPADQMPAVPPVEPPPPRFIEHKQQRLDPGKPLWAAVAPKIPRVSHDRRLHMPQAGRAVDLKALRREFPALPFITPAPAAARAASCECLDRTPR